MIQVYHLTKTYGSKQALSDVTFTAKNGRVTGFVGPNGAGKSTTMRAIACYEIPDDGVALVDGHQFDEAETPARTMGVYLGAEHLPLAMTGRAYLNYVCKVSGISGERVDELLQTVELEDSADKPIKSYSMGMKQRIGLAAAIAGDPGTLMLDEPVNGLDPMGVQWLRGLLRAQAKAGKAVLLSSHLLSELELVADSVVMIDHGRVVEQGDMASLERGDTKRVLVSTTDDARLAELLSQQGVEAAFSDDGLLVRGLSAREVGKLAYDNGLLVDHLVDTHSSLEQVFMDRAAAHVEPAPKEASDP